MPMTPILKSAERAIENVKHWKPLTSAPPGSQAYTGQADGWTFNIVAFSIEDQGFPKGSRGFDGSGTIVLGGRGTMLRLTRELAEKAVKLAEAQAS